MIRYTTKQRRELLHYLALHADETLNARQIAQALAQKQISKSAVYRNLCALEQDGAVRRVAVAGQREVYYRYADADECRACLHLSCKQCGKTFHMHTAQADALIDRIASEEHFAVDRTETVLYGLCDQCRKPNEKA